MSGAASGPDRSFAVKNSNNTNSTINTLNTSTKISTDLDNETSTSESSVDSNQNSQIHDITTFGTNTENTKIRLTQSKLRHECNFPLGGETVLPEVELDTHTKKKVCYLCDVHLKMENSTKRFSSVFSSIQNNINLRSIIYEPKPFYLSIAPVHPTHSLVDDPVIIPFEACKNHSESSNQPYFATVSLKGYNSTLNCHSGFIYRSSNFPSIEIKNDSYIAFIIYSNCGSPVADFTHYIKFRLSKNQKRWFRFELFNSLDPDGDFPGYHSLESQVEICLLNYENRYFLVGNVNILFYRKGDSCTSLFRLVHWYFHYLEASTKVRVTKSAPCTVDIGCSQCIDENFTFVPKIANKVQNLGVSYDFLMGLYQRSIDQNTNLIDTVLENINILCINPRNVSNFNAANSNERPDADDGNQTETTT